MNQYQNPYEITPLHRPRAWVNGMLIILNITYFLYLELAGSSEDAYFMLQHGAMYGPCVLEDHEYYRLLTSMFMHFGINHIVNNMLVLFVLGDNLERALGKVKYLLFYLLCGVGANVVSMLFELPVGDWAVGAGASGAIFGVVGGLIYVVAVNKGCLEDLNSRQLVVMAAFSLYLGFTSTGVDNAAHVGGLVIGIILAALFYRKPKRTCRADIWSV
ncbi:rhomboid family intramembrane serine protease [Clostridium sp. OM02-18AC]|uniref:rhomboid family intramembrane serine protease n=1 Tax=Clostridium sp. OM02-18AC TaxID=2292311 RepID=UPI000E4DDF59|nr:rhomboid family intramembrane serine protease [Clostridium sp. OM02-18AC]RHV65699.1 rhomboid family intramembrane serine protease [Clostridium sp. OM02-18AC]